LYFVQMVFMVLHTTVTKKLRVFVPFSCAASQASSGTKIT
jgi:hypothetical protein